MAFHYSGKRFTTKDTEYRNIDHSYGSVFNLQTNKSQSHSVANNGIAKDKQTYVAEIWCNEVYVMHEFTSHNSAN